MQRARRLASIAVIAVLGVLALAGCRSEPGVAAYVGDRSYTVDEVDRILDEIKEQVPPEQQGEVRREVVRLLVVRTAATDYARTHNISVPTSDPAAFAQRTNLPPDARFTELAAEYNAVLTALHQSVQPVAPSEADQREAFQNVTVQGQKPQDTFESVRQYFSQEVMGQSVALRNLLADAVGQADVQVNPRYGALSYRVPVQVGQAQTWLSVPLGEGDQGMVIDPR